MEELAITGMGVVSPIGIGRQAFAAALADPAMASGAAIRRGSTVLDGERFADAEVAEVWDFDATVYLGAKGLRTFDRLTKLMIVAAKLALEDAGIKKDGSFIALSADRVGICSSTAYGSLDAITELNLVAELEDPRYINPARFPNTVINAAAGYVSIWEGLEAPNVTIVNGNCGSLDAVLTAEIHLAHSRGDAFLVGGGEVLTEPLYLAFRKLGVLGSGRPGGGTALGEGAAYVAVERLHEARARKAHILATIAGYGTSFEAPPSNGLLLHAGPVPVRRAIDAALADAGVGPEDVDVVSAAMSGNDALERAELAGIHGSLGEEVAVVAHKRFFGETFGAAGALGMAGALALFDGAPLGPLVSGTPPARLSTIVVVNVGFYGNVSCVVLRKTA